ncbi:MAG: transglutaminase family protein [Pseudomonadota bacterium]
MRLNVTHKTVYRYDEPVGYALQQLRLMPKNSNGQNVLSWSTRVEGGRKELSYTDQHRNHVELISAEPDTQQITVLCEGEVDLTLADGVVGKHIGLAPLWYYMRTTPLTSPGSALRKFVRELPKSEDGDIAFLHALMAAIEARVSYEIGKTHPGTTAEDAFNAGHGVCQDHTHIMLSAARLLGYPARYVSGYLMLEDRVDQDASHAWAEIHVDAIGWIGFDVSNSISPDERYIRVATGLDYTDAAPVSGMRFGSSDETMVVSVQVEQ